MITVVFIIIIIIFYLFWKDNYGYNGKRMPGPLRLPLIGNLHQIALTGCKLPHEALSALSKKYGSLMSLKLGIKETVIVSSFDEIHELLQKDECQGRIADQVLLDERSWGRHIGIVCGNGEMWKAVRRFTVRNLRDFGFGKKTSMEKTMTEEINDLITRTKLKASQNGGKVHIDTFFNLSILNVLWTMVAGKRYSHDDPILNYLVDINVRCFKAAKITGADISIAYPILRKIFPKLTGAAELKLCITELQKFCFGILNEHRALGNYTTNPESFVDLFLKEIDTEASEKPNPYDRYFTDEQFVIVLMDLFQTGSDTVSKTLSYGILFMILNSQVQKKVQLEIYQIAPPGTQLNFSHKPMMPYTQATLMEIARLANTVPIIPPRKVTKDFYYKGYQLKEGLTILANMHTIFSDKSYWKDPETFRPERFIGADGQLCNTERMAQFGFGKRYCMGESLASPALFLYFTTMLKHFELKKVPGQDDPTTVPIVSATLSPQPFDIIINSRE